MGRFRLDPDAVWFWLIVVGLAGVIIGYFLGWITLSDNVGIQG